MLKFLSGERNKKQVNRTGYFYDYDENAIKYDARAFTIMKLKKSKKYMNNIIKFNNIHIAYFFFNDLIHIKYDESYIMHNYYEN